MFGLRPAAIPVRTEVADAESIQPMGPLCEAEQNVSEAMMDGGHGHESFNAADTFGAIVICLVILIGVALFFLKLWAISRVSKKSFPYLMPTTTPVSSVQSYCVPFPPHRIAGPDEPNRVADNWNDSAGKNAAAAEEVTRSSQKVKCTIEQGSTVVDVNRCATKKVSFDEEDKGLLVMSQFLMREADTSEQRSQMLQTLMKWNPAAFRDYDNYSKVETGESCRLQVRNSFDEFL